MLKIFLSVLFFSCQKQIDRPAKENKLTQRAKNSINGHLKQANTFSSDVVLKWIDLNRRILLTTSRVAPGVRVNREFGYTGIALYESVVPGMPSYQSLSSQLNEMPVMPQTQPGAAYYWSASANAALAAMNRFFYPTTSAANKASMDSLENALNIQYEAGV